MLRQGHLTRQIIELLQLDDANPKITPASTPLGKHLDSEAASGQLNYRSAIGMLLYLGNNSCPDCSF